MRISHMYDFHEYRFLIICERKLVRGWAEIITLAYYALGPWLKSFKDSGRFVIHAASTASGGPGSSSVKWRETSHWRLSYHPVSMVNIPYIQWIAATVLLYYSQFRHETCFGLTWPVYPLVFQHRVASWSHLASYVNHRTKWQGCPVAGGFLHLHWGLHDDSQRYHMHFSSFFNTLPGNRSLKWQFPFPSN